MYHVIHITECIGEITFIKQTLIKICVHISWKNMRTVLFKTKIQTTSVSKCGNVGFLLNRDGSVPSNVNTYYDTIR